MERQPLEFPMVFPIKAIGHETEDFEELVFDLVRQHVPTLTRDDLSSRPSSGGKYISVTVTFEAESQEQVDNIYLALRDSGRVVVLL